MQSGFMFFWAVLVSAFMIITYRNKIKADENLSKVNWDTYKLKLSQTWWNGFLWASVVFTIFYLLFSAGLTK
jgi:hypothetical protein